MSDSDSLNVLIVTQPTEYGVGICVRDQVAAAVAAGHEVTVACPDASHGPLADWVTRAGARHHALNLRRQPGVGDIAAMLALRRLSRGKDVVHVHSSKAGAVGRLAVMSMPKRRRPAVLFTTHYWSWQVEGRMAAVYKLVERFLAPRTDAIIAVSEQEADEGRAVLGSAGGHIRVIPNGVDRKRFSPDGDRAERGEAPLIVCVGRLSRQKGQDVAVRALSMLENDDALLRLVGDEYPPGERDRLEALASAVGVADRVEWWGKVKDTAPLFRAADVVIAPSRWEGMSLVFLEAMSCGAAIVASDVFGSDAIGTAGVIIRQDDPDELARAVDHLLENPGERARLGAAARSRSADFDLAVTLSRTVELWAELARKPHPMPANTSR